MDTWEFKKKKKIEKGASKPYNGGNGIVGAGLMDTATNRKKPAPANSIRDGFTSSSTPAPANNIRDGFTSASTPAPIKSSKNTSLNTYKPATTKSNKNTVANTASMPTPKNSIRDGFTSLSKPTTSYNMEDGFTSAPVKREKLINNFSAQANENFVRTRQNMATTNSDNKKISTNVYPQATNSYTGYSRGSGAPNININQNIGGSLKDGRSNMKGEFSNYYNMDITPMKEDWRAKRKPRNLIEIAKDEYLSPQEIRNLADFPNEELQNFYITDIMSAKGVMASEVLKKEAELSKIDMSVFPKDIQDEIKMISSGLTADFAQKRYNDLIKETEKRQKNRRAVDRSPEYYASAWDTGVEGMPKKIAKRKIDIDLYETSKSHMENEPYFTLDNEKMKNETEKNSEFLKMAGRQLLDVPNNYIPRNEALRNSMGITTADVAVAKKMGDIGTAVDIVDFTNNMYEDYKEDGSIGRDTLDDGIEKLLAFGGGKAGAFASLMLGVNPVLGGIVGSLFLPELYSNEHGSKLIENYYTYDPTDPYAINISGFKENKK